MMRFVSIFVIIICAITANAQLLHEFKGRLSPALSALAGKQTKSDSLEVTISLKNITAFRSWLGKVRLRASYSPALVIKARVSRTQLEQLVSDTSVIFADLVRKPKEEFGTGTLDISLNRINLAHRLFPSINGDKIKVSLKEQLFDSTDIDIKGRFFSSTIEASTQSGHASAMATILGGAGNSTLSSTGVATGVQLSSSDFETLLPDADAIYDQFNISVQNHSYGTGIENFYGSDAAAYDASVLNHPSLVHVFSSGNSGFEISADGNYSGIGGFANLTGSFKMAKNIITVGATDSFDVVMGASSKGPAYDGRVKPEMVAFGEDGSSGAAALVSGAAVLIQQEFKQLFGSLPSAALTKAVLLNSADNKNRQVNYTSGYGSLDVRKALTVIADHHFMEGEVSQYQSQNISIEVPANISRLKVMLVWTDAPAAANASKALQNDLDATLNFSPTTPAWLPWVLDPAADATALQLPATRKMDTLNNVEQITVDDPLAGRYVFTVNADKIFTAAQKFAVAYLFDTTQHFEWTFPTSADKLLSNKNSLVRWQTNIKATGTLEYSIDNGSWTFLKNINAEEELAGWPVPDTIAMAKLRINIPSLNITRESEPFVVSPPTDLHVGFNCSDSVLYYWHPHPGTVYQVYRLGSKYMEPIFTAPDSFFIIKKSPDPFLRYAIAPLVNDGTGFRSYAIDYTTQGVDCYFQSFFASLNGLNQASLDLELGTLFHVSDITFQKLTSTGYKELNTIHSPSENIISISDNQLTGGVNAYRAFLTLNDGSKIYSSVETVYYFPADPVIIFPNPVSRNHPFQIINNDPGMYSVTIYDLNGKPIYTSSLDANNKQIQGIPFSKGMYLVRISSADGKGFSKKLIVK